MSGVQELSGTTLKGYHLGEVLGWTNHTAVYRARRNAAQWAVKVVDAQLAPDSSLADRLQREAGLLADISNPSILPIQDAGRSGRLTYATSPLIRGRTLRDLMRAGRIDNDQAWTILSRLADALDSVHYRGLAFRALKPSHVLVDDGNIYLAEFGVTTGRVGQLALATSGYHLTAPQYLAPEQVEGHEADWRADLYALAVLVFELLTGTSLHSSVDPRDALRATLDGSRPSAVEREPALPPSVDAVLSRAMSRRPEQRHSSAWELLTDLVTLPEDRPADGGRPAWPAGGWPAAPPSPPPVPADEPAAPPKAPIPEDSMIAVLARTGVPVFRARHEVILNAYFAALVRHAREACAERWPDVAVAARLPEYVVDEPPDDLNRSAPVAAVSRLAQAIEDVFGPGAVELLRHWGRLTTDYWIRRTQQLQEGDVTYMKPLRLRTTPHQKVEDTLYVFTRNLDRIRGERLSTWKRVDKRQFWVVHYDNLTAVGRRRPAKSCHFSSAALEQALRWGDAANEWVVDEAECGCVTGTYDCVFTIHHVKL